MFRTMSGERHGESSSCPAGRGVASAGLVSQENSWIGLLSRPAMTFLQNYLPGRPLRAPSRSRSGTGPGDDRGDLLVKTCFVDAERDFLRQLDDIMPLNVTRHPGPDVRVLRCQDAGAAGLLEPRAGGPMPWVTAGSLRELGIQSAEGQDLDFCHQQTHEIGYLSSAWTSLSRVLISSSQVIVPPAGKEWGPAGASLTGSGGRSRTWWDSFWGGEDSSRAREGGGPAPVLCPQEQPASETKPPGTSQEGWTLGENSGAPQHRGEPGNNGGLHTAQDTQPVGVRVHRSLVGAGTGTAGSVAALPSPETQNGCSSPEEDPPQLCVQAGQLEMMRERGAETTGSGNETDVTSEQEVEEEEEEEQEAAAPCASPEDPTPQCQNKAIAFIMGCPCSDDSQSDESSDDDDDDEDEDDGFDSEGLSDPSDSSDEEDEEDSDSEAESEPDAEAERLWRSLCRSVDPYNPRNFTAQLPAARKPPRTIPGASPPSSSPGASPPSSTPGASPPSFSPGADVWDDSASEADEAESLRLLSSFSCSSDPYSPFNFQAPIRTRGPAGAPPGAGGRARAAPPGAGGRARAAPPSSCRSAARHEAASPPEYSVEEAEERLDSGFSELSTHSCSVTKKVRFRDDVEEFFASGGEEEDRRGPWEELARDRCRFLRRCLDTEQSIAYVLQPQHRRRVWRRLAAARAVLDA